MCSFLIEKSYYEKFRRYKEAQRTLKCQPHYPEIIYMHVLIYVCNVLLYAILYIIIHIYLFFTNLTLHKTTYTFTFYIIAIQNTFYVKISCCIVFSYTFILDFFVITLLIYYLFSIYLQFIFRKYT